MIDEIDKKLLRHLQTDSRTTNSQLAAKAGISASSCWRRIKSLEDIGLIQGYSALLNRDIAGFEFSAIVHLSLSRQEENTVQEFVRAVAVRPEILDCYATTGDFDYHLRVVVKNITEYNTFLDEFLFKLPGVAQIRSNIVLKDIKSSQSLPFNQ
ncbi:MAG: Lrp/AsnC family transcriptional regulator [Sneathiella sp.]|nr:Lrp/AsnC family transcriptional regulator [Sneathiella sp.]